MDLIVKLIPFEEAHFPVKHLGAEPFLNVNLLAAYRGNRDSYQSLVELSNELWNVYNWK